MSKAERVHGKLGCLAKEILPHVFLSTHFTVFCLYRCIRPAFPQDISDLHVCGYSFYLFILRELSLLTQLPKPVTLASSLTALPPAVSSSNHLPATLWPVAESTPPAWPPDYHCPSIFTHLLPPFSGMGLLISKSEVTLRLKTFGRLPVTARQTFQSL